MQDLPIRPYPTPLVLDEARRQADAALNTIDQHVKAAAYAAWLGYYKTNLKTIKFSLTQLVEAANSYARTLNYPGDQPPPLKAQTVGKMGMRGVPGLNIIKGGIPNKQASGPDEEGER